MNLPLDSKTNSPNDDDINELFKKQAVDIPATLDSTILAASRAENHSTNTQNHSTSPPSWLAFAAAVVMIVAITPLMLTSPNSALEPAPFHAPTQQYSPAAISIPADELPTVSREAQRLLAPSATNNAAPKALLRSSSTGMQPMHLEITEESKTFRGTTNNWISEINRLISEGHLSQAKKEYDLFESAHPSYESNIKFPEK